MDDLKEKATRLLRFWTKAVTALGSPRPFLLMPPSRAWPEARRTGRADAQPVTGPRAPLPCCPRPGGGRALGTRVISAALAQTLCCFSRFSAAFLPPEETRPAPASPALARAAAWLPAAHAYLACSLDQPAEQQTKNPKHPPPKNTPRGETPSEKARPVSSK